ncbi:MAG: CatB-related O-acetyltransferase [Bacteroidales bacterium]
MKTVLKRIYSLIKNLKLLSDIECNLNKGKKVHIYSPHIIVDVRIGDYSYVAPNATISKTEIGKFCSIGPNLLCGYGIHPLDGISTSPWFYSVDNQRGSFAKTNKMIERKQIFIGNDVFIGANVTILDGVKIGDGAVIGAGCVVTKDVPNYAIVIGCPMTILRYRFSLEVINALLEIRWWNFDEVKLKDVESLFFHTDEFVKQFCAIQKSESSAK